MTYHAKTAIVLISHVHITGALAEEAPSPSILIRHHKASHETGEFLENKSAHLHTASERRSSSEKQSSWHAPYIASQAVIMDLTELYFEVVYPIFPSFHQPSFIRHISQAQYTTDRALFAVTMAVCALVRCRIRDDSVTNPKWNIGSLREPGPEVFYAESKKQLANFDMVASLNVLRAHAILAITVIQNGSIRAMSWHLGTYQTLVAVDGLHDESNWPSGIGVIEREERRRLVSGHYHLTFQKCYRL